jgi:ketosteroid isomerase-like protein
MKRFLAIVLTLSMWAFAPQYAAAQNVHGEAQIKQVIETFRSAIINKDKDAFLKLFLKDDITWSGVTTDASIERMYAARPKPEMRRPNKIFSSNQRDFIKMIAEDKARIEETFSNVRIDSDGEVAQVWFDYSFMSGNYKENWGKESWQMVRTESGWKIAAVIWSQELNPTPPPK